MKLTTLTFLFIPTLFSSLSAAQPAVGTVSTEQSFALRQDGSFVAQTLSDYDGSILVVMLMTPWCPICATHTAAVGDGILDHFNADSRGALKGQNNQGVPIRSVVLSTLPEPTFAVFYESTMASLQTLNGFGGWGLDSATDHSNQRALLAYYRGGSLGPENLTDQFSLYDWGDDRRRVIVLNMVNGSPGHQYREILLNMNSFSSENDATARAAINAVAPASEELSFEQWRGNQAFSSGTDALTSDPDKDGSINAFEFYFGTRPTDASSKDSGPSILEENGQRYLVFRRARGIGGFSLEHQHSTDLKNWNTLDASGIESSELGDVDEQRLLLPAPAAGDTTNFYRLQLTIP